MNKPLIQIGTQLKDGKITAIRKDSVDIRTLDGKIKKVSLTTIEKEVENG